MTHTYYVPSSERIQTLKTCNGQGCSLAAEMLRMGDETQSDIHSYAKRQYKENVFLATYQK